MYPSGLFYAVNDVTGCHYTILEPLLEQ